MSWPKRIILIALVVGALVIVGLIVYPGKPPIPPSIKAQLTSTLLAPIGSDYQGAHQTAKYDSQKKLLSYRVHMSGEPSVTVSEQPAPSQFTDISGYYSQFINDLGEYESFGSVDGTVYLVHLKNQAGEQAAVLSDAGTLMFVKPDSSLSDSQWRAFFQAVQVIR
jgi:hypothetical protein